MMLSDREPNRLLPARGFLYQLITLVAGACRIIGAVHARTIRDVRRRAFHSRGSLKLRTLSGFAARPSPYRFAAAVESPGGGSDAAIDEARNTHKPFASRNPRGHPRGRPAGGAPRGPTRSPPYGWRHLSRSGRGGASGDPGSLRGYRYREGGVPARVGPG